MLAYDAAASCPLMPLFDYAVFFPLMISLSPLYYFELRHFRQISFFFRWLALATRAGAASYAAVASCHATSADAAINQKIFASATR
jgi:hypothetical protein